MICIMNDNCSHNKPILAIHASIIFNTIVEYKLCSGI